MGYLCATCGGVGGVFATNHAHSDKDSCIAGLKAENAKLRANVEHWQKVAEDVNAVLTKKAEELAQSELQVRDYQNVVSLAVVDLDVAQQFGVTSNRVESAIRMLREVLTTAGKQRCELCHGPGRPECVGSSGCYCGCHADNQTCDRFGCGYIKKLHNDPATRTCGDFMVKRNHDVVAAARCLCGDPHGPLGTARIACPMHSR